MACTPAILADLETSDTFYRWLNGQHAIADPLMLSSNTISPADTITLQGVQASLQAHSNCLTEKNSSTSNVNSDNSLKRTTITELQNNIKSATNDLQVSQDRALLVRHPEMSRSYYESILPIGRPMAHYTVPILIGVSTFLLSLSFFMLLSIMKIDARILVAAQSYSSSRSSYTTPFWMMSGVAVILLGLTIYAFTR
jgi:hypothetical protein